MNCLLSMPVKVYQQLLEWQKLELCMAKYDHPSEWWDLDGVKWIGFNLWDGDDK